MSTATHGLLPFHKNILEDVVERESSLVVLAKGIGLQRLLSFFLHLYAGASDKLVFIIGQHHDTAGMLGVRDVRSGMSAPEREEMYRMGGIVSISSRMLVVDMLSGRVPLQHVTGVIVMRAENVTEGSNDAFILRILRRENEDSFIKAFSDSPESYSSGFNKLKKSLQFLSLRHVSIWPRFQLQICADLDRTPINVIEVRQPLTELMAQCQTAIIDCVTSLVSDLKRTSSLVDVEDVDPVSAMTRAFDATIKSQLDPNWHRVPYRTKQLVNDIKTLRRLLTYLISYDAVSFYTFLEMVLASSNAYASGATTREESPWLYLDAANALFAAARARVYKRSGEEGMILPVIEENPKWKVVKDILDEIGHPSAVLVMVKDRRTATQLQEYLTEDESTIEDGHTRMMRRLLNRYVKWKGGLKVVDSNLKATGEKEAVFGSTAVNSAEAARPSKRRRVRGGGPSQSFRRAGDSRQFWSAQLEKEAIELAGEDGRAALKTAFIARNQTVAKKNPPGVRAGDPLDQSVSQAEEELVMDYAEYEEEPIAFDPAIYGVFDIAKEGEQTVMVCPYGEAADDAVLARMKPTHVVIYDPQLAFIRRLEVHHALTAKSNGGASDMKVYFMLYENSVEEQLYLSSIRKEKEAFETVIKEKASMALEMDSKRTEEDIFTRSFAQRDPRNPGKSNEVSLADPKVIVDMREFGSALPSILHVKHFKVVAVTLEVGDYILTPDICVERKSLSDLIQSMNSGRLYAQVEAMSTFYDQPVLLIEFESTTAFGFGDWLNDNSVQAKLVLLTLTFPKLKIIWSSSAHATAQIFEELKKNHPQPSEDEAKLLGVDADPGADLVYNLAPQEVLRSMPGVVTANYRVLMHRYRNLQELCEAGEEELREVIGGERAKALNDFVCRDVGKDGDVKKEETKKAVNGRKR